MNHADKAQVAQVARKAQDGFTKLQQDLQAAGATEKEALTIMLSVAQLKAHLIGIFVSGILPGEELFPGGEKRSLN